MRRPLLFAIIAVALFAQFYSYGAKAQVRAKADIACQPTTDELQYDCIIKLADPRTNHPLSGLNLAVGADMPSMPATHNVRTVKAAEDLTKGTYKARIALEMYGEWTLRLDLSGPIRDRVVKVLRFERDRVGEPISSRTPSHHRH